MKPDPILTDIEDALEKHDVSATKFGYFVAGDPALVNKLRGGRLPRGPMRGKIRSALDRLAKKGTL